MSTKSMTRTAKVRKQLGFTDYGQKDGNVSEDNAGESDVDVVKSLLEDVRDEAKNHAEDLIKKTKKGINDNVEELKGRADESLTTINEIKEHLQELQQEMVSGKAATSPLGKSIGDQFMDDEGVQTFLKNRPKSATVSVEIKDITSAMNSGGALVEPDRRGPVAAPTQKLRIRDLLTKTKTSSNNIEYERETGFTNSADVVAEGVLKPESTISYELANAPVRTIAHWMRFTKQIFDDAPRLRSAGGTRLLYGLKLKEEVQILKGDGTGENLEGLITAASAYSAPLTITGETPIDTIRLMILQTVLAQYEATGVTLNPVDWGQIELTTDTTGQYIVSNPQSGATPRMWRLPVVESLSMSAGEILTGAFDMGAELVDREDASIALSTEDRDNFVTNRVTMLVEERLALPIYRPESFIYKAP